MHIPAMKVSSYLLLFTASLGYGSTMKKRYVDTPTLKAHNFNDGTLGPFESCNTLSPSYVASTSGFPAYSGGFKLTASFDEDYYDETRNRKSAEFCASNSNFEAIHKEGWQGFALYIPSDNYPANSEAIIAQQFCGGYCSSWCGTLALVGTSLIVDHRSSCGTPTTTTVVTNVTFDEWHTYIINVRYSNIEDGVYNFWFDQELVYSATNINLGFDDSWTSNGSMVTGAGWKNGMYNADPSYYQNTTKVLYFDNVSWYNVDDGAADGYDVVDPL
ncbi:hypothetical protein VNI00_005359 [Paramarasmius palmivorus]|uniref:Alginate lyase n=1 Tax=Paramarasmius palmivorus TaxID=297713 RepID=A0AAW0DDR9_9AGAR